MRQIEADGNEVTEFRQIIRAFVLVIAIYSLAACVAPFLSLVPLPITTKSTLYRASDHFHILAVVFLGVLARDSNIRLWLVSILALPTMWIFAKFLRGPWVSPGTFDRYADPFLPVVASTLIAYAVGTVLGASLNARIRGFLSSPAFSYVFLGVSVPLVIFAEAITPFESVVLPSIHLGLTAVGALAAILDAFAESILGETK